MKQIFTVVIFFLMLSCGKDTVISAKVETESGNPLDSVLVQVMSTDLYTYTDKEGNFKIDTKGRGEELIFNKKGYFLGRVSINEMGASIQLKKKE